MFSLRYFCKASVIFLRYPSAIIKLFGSSKSAADHIDRLRKQKWSKSQVTRRYLYGFYIELNKEDTTGVAPSIGIDGWYEPEQTELLRKILKKKMVVVDIGANIGWYTLLSAKIVGSEGMVLSFEPEPNSFSLLKRSIEENKFTNIRAFRECVSNITGKRTLWVASENLGGHSIIRKCGDQGISVASNTLDTSLTNLGISNVDVLKIDAEGAEPEIIEGAQESLKGDRIKNVLMEWDPRAWSTQAKLFEELFERFEVYQLIKSPRLIRRLSMNSFHDLPLANLYLRLIT